MSLAFETNEQKDEASSLVNERSAARALSGAFAWPTLVLFLAAVGLQVGLIFGALSGEVSYWVAVPVLSVLAYVHYTPIHEASHYNISGNRKGLRWLDAAVGWVSSIPLFSMYPFLRRSHLLHHSYVNTDRDPDANCRGSFLRLIVYVIVQYALILLPWVIMSRLFPKETGFNESTAVERWGSDVTHTIYLASLAAFWWTGHLGEAVMLWFVPGMFGTGLLIFAFSWLPHYPLEKTGRYDHARLSRWPGSRWLLLGQDLHLVHHLWPQVPFYRYGKLCRALKPVLIEKGVRSEGLLVGKYASRLPIE